MARCDHVKVCRTCRTPKHVEQYHARSPAKGPHRTRQTGAQSECKTCAHARRTRNRQANARG